MFIVQECLGPDVPWVMYKTLPDNIPLFLLDKNEKVLNQASIKVLMSFII